MKYVLVLPLVKTGKTESAFTYETTLELEVGSLVSIPLRNRYVKGLVTKIVSKPKFKTKEVKKVLSLEPVLTENQIIIAEKIAEYYLCNFSDVIPTILSFDFGKKRRIVKKEPAPTKKLEAKLELTPDQKNSFKKIISGGPGSKYLLFGVTGSGKTEVYLQLAEEALANKKSVIILIPEISLTPQTAGRFLDRFGDTVAVWHSHLKETEKFETWQKIKSGEKQIILGARSAIFAPLNNLGYIIIDEEHESSYKQDQTPRYETAQVAEWLSDTTGAKLILGSATPRVESFKKSESGDYQLCRLENRIVQAEMPPVKVVDLRDEFRKGNKSIISDDLYEATVSALKNKQQVVMFVNRRGASTFVVCRDCGHVEECPRCEIPLTFHPLGGRIGLVCHHCDFKKSVPTSCPDCKSLAIKYFGLGTQRAEIEIKKMFPKAKVVRMDRDTTQKRGSHETIFNDFSAGEFDILIGTQIIAKGWDLPNVAVVGVISADTMLNLPDFKSAERTFSLLTQVAGRTGRGYHPGQVVIQTYNPENYAVRAAKKHDYLEFYQREIIDREKYLYPPFCNLIKLTHSNTDSSKAETEAKRLFDLVHSALKESTDIQLMGPTPAFIPKLAGKYRWQIVLKIPNVKNYDKTKKEIGALLLKEAGPGWTVNVNPDGLL